MISSILDQLPSGLMEDVIWYSMKAGTTCPETGFRMVTLALFLGRLQASSPNKASRKTRMRMMVVPFFIATFHREMIPALMTFYRAMKFPTQVSR